MANHKYDEQFLYTIKDMSIKMGNRDKDNANVFDAREIGVFTSTIHQIQYKHFMILLDTAFSFADKQEMVNAVNDIALIKRYVNKQGSGLLDLAMHVYRASIATDSALPGSAGLLRIRNIITTRFRYADLKDFCIYILKMYFSPDVVVEFCDIQQRLVSGDGKESDLIFLCSVMIDIQNQLEKMVRT